MSGRKPLGWKPADDCPAADKHTSAPRGYMAFFDWAEEMAKTHDNVQCSTCGLWTQWVPRKIDR